MRTAHGCSAVFLRNRCVAASSFVILLVIFPSMGAGADIATAGDPEIATASDPEIATASDPEIATASDPEASTLSRQIDQLLKPIVSSMVAAKEADGTLLRRLSLDLRGVVPTREELDEFTLDGSSNRWSKWVDQFLQDPLCDEHLVAFLDRTLMLRRAYRHVDRASWIQYLREHVATGTPLDCLCRELLYTPWWNRQKRAEQRFYLDREGDPHLITRDLARVFLGRDLQCAQCHDHPLVNDFRQVDYHGVLAFVSAGSLAEVTYKDAEDKDQKLQLYIEKAAGDAPFESVFERGTLLRTATRLSGQREYIDEYHLPLDRYLDAAHEGALAGAAIPPKVSRREQLAQRLADRGNGPFVANWANRLWALIYGRGLVHPVDMIEPDNPPTNPELFEVIATGLLQADMRIKPFVRQLVMTEAYQRGATPQWLQLVQLPDEAIATEIRQQLDEQLVRTGEQLQTLIAREQEDLLAYEQAREAWLKVQSERSAVRAELDTTEAAMIDANKKHEEATAARNAAEKKLADSRTRGVLLDESAAKMEQALALVGSDDAELSQAIAVAKQHAEAARGQVPELEKGVADSHSAESAAATTLKASENRVNEVVEKLKPIQSDLLAVDELSLDARERWVDSRSSAVATRQSIARLKRQVDWIDELAKDRQLTKSLQDIDGQIAKTKASSDRTRTMIADLGIQVATAEEALKSANQELVQAKVALEQHQHVINTLECTLTSIDDATKLVSKVDALVAAQDALRQEIAARKPSVGQLQSTIDLAREKTKVKTETLVQQQAEMDSQNSVQQSLAQQLASLQKQRDEQKSQLEATKANLLAQTQTISTDSETQLACSGLFPLTAEQLCWSTLRVTGVLDAYIRTEIAELEKESPLTPDADLASKEHRRQQAVRQAMDKLRGNVDQYVTLYASGPDKTQDDFFASADQALYVANGGSVYSWAGPGNNNPTQVATSLSDPVAVAQVLYWSYLCRQPTSEETEMISVQLASAGDQRNTIIQEMAWSLLASAEFRFTR